MAALDRHGGLIATRATPAADVPCGSGSCHTREAIQIVLASSGQASVRVVREARGYYPTDVDAWYSLDREQAAEIGYQQALLLAEILGLPPPAAPPKVPPPGAASGPPAGVNPSGRDAGARCQVDSDCKSDACFRGYCMPKK